MLYYIYEWFDVDTGYIFYVGKGCKQRYKALNHRNELFLDYLKSHNCSSRITKKFSTENEALTAENERILELKSLGQCSCNLDNGGTGGLSFVWTEEMRSYKSKFNPMKQEGQKKRMSANNPMKRESVVEKVAQHKRKPVVINGVRFDSVRKASKAFNVCEGTIIKWCRQGYDYFGNPCRYEDQEQKEYTFERYNLGGSKRLSYQGKEYISASELAAVLGLHFSTVSKWAKRGFDTNGNPCRYIQDQEDKVFIPPNKHPNAKPIEVNGIIYPSKREAEKQLGLCKGGLAPFVSGNRKHMKYVCRYVNQQPSRENSDKSIPEGPTTRG